MSRKYKIQLISKFIVGYDYIREVMVLSKKKANLIIKEDYCKGCRICVEFCPTKVLTMEGGKVKIADIEKCIKCGLCELRCPDYAIYLGGNEDEE